MSSIRAGTVTQAVRQLVERAELAEKNASDERLRANTGYAQLKHRNEEFDELLEKYKQLQNTVGELQKRDRDRELLLHVTMRKLDALNLGAHTANIKADTTGSKFERLQQRESRTNARCIDAESRLQTSEALTTKLKLRLNQAEIRIKALTQTLKLTEERADQAQKAAGVQNRKLGLYGTELANFKEKLKTMVEERDTMKFKMQALKRQRDQAMAQNESLSNELEIARSALDSVMAITTIT